MNAKKHPKGKWITINQTNEIPQMALNLKFNNKIQQELVECRRDPLQVEFSLVHQLGLQEQQFLGIKIKY